MCILITGAAGFIGMHVAQILLARGEKIIGIDNMNDYYDVNLKYARLARLTCNNGFKFEKIDISDIAALKKIFVKYPKIDRIINLAAQAGVRYSLENPHAYIQSNIVGYLNILEMARRKGNGFKHFVYASSSSVYGGNKKIPFSTDDKVDSPVSLYAATKKSNELIGHSYAHLFRIPQTGLRFFTVYGPWGRPDMAAYIFTKKIFAGDAIPVFNNGDMQRDFTYIDDIADGVIKCLDNPPIDNGEDAPHLVYNIGNNHPEELMDMIGLIEKSTNHKAKINFLPMQQGDVKSTMADITPIENDLGFAPKTALKDGIPNFVNWYRKYHNMD